MLVLFFVVQVHYKKKNLRADSVKNSANGRIVSANGYEGLPVHNLVHHLPLLTAGLLEIDTGGLNATVAQEICKQGNILIFLKKILGK